jgi:Rod binding domain-containing protein
MTAPISRIGGQQVVSRDAGSNGHDHVARQLDGTNNHGAAKAQPPRNKKVEEVAKMYEKQFLGEMFKAMRSTVSETEKPSMAQNIYNSQRDDQYVDAWSEQGGIGFSNIIYDQIMERFFGQGGPGHALKKQGMIPLTNREITSVSKVENGVAQPIVPVVPAVTAKAGGAAMVAAPKRTFENTEPMPAPTPAPLNDSRTSGERLAAGELFPESATAKGMSKNEIQMNSGKLNRPEQTALQIEVRPSPTGVPAKIQAPWDATVVQATKLDGSRTAVTLEHGQGLRSTLVFDGVLAAGATTAGQKIPRGQAIGTLNQDAKSFLWNLATQSSAQAPVERSAEQTSGQD